MDHYLELARDFIRKKGNGKFALIESSIKEDPDFISFVYQTKRYIETRSFMDMIIGHGNTFILKHDGRIFETGSAHSFEKSRTALKEKLRLEREIRAFDEVFDIRKQYDLVLDKIVNREKLVEVLFSHSLHYILPEYIGGGISQTKKLHSRESLHLAFSIEPVKISSFLRNEMLPSLLQDLNNTHLCRYLLQEREVQQYAKGDLRPRW